ncbi:MAG TPA: hypothetical protein VF721_01720, partial [Pyrinomonadaceae bacterium]
MKLEHDELEEVIFGKTGFRRFTQDSPILPDVWLAFGDDPKERQDLLLTPTWGETPGQLAESISARLEKESDVPHIKELYLSSPKRRRSRGIAYNVSTVALKLYFDEMIRVILPMTKWWDEYILIDSDVKDSNGNKKSYFSLVVEDKSFRDNLIAALEVSAKKSTEKPWDLNRALNP